MTASTQEIEQIRADRKKISAACGHSPNRLIARYLTRAKIGKKANCHPGTILKVQELPEGE